MENKNKQDLGLFQQRLIFQITLESVNYYETMAKDCHVAASPSNTAI